MKRTLAILALAVVLALAFVAPMWLGRYRQHLMGLWLVTAIARARRQPHHGLRRPGTLAQAGFIGIGAYTTALMIKGGTLNGPFPSRPRHGSFLGAVLDLLRHRRVGGLAFFFGLLIGFPFRAAVQKHYLAFVTIAFAVFLSRLPATRCG